MATHCNEPLFLYYLFFFSYPLFNITGFHTKEEQIRFPTISNNGIETTKDILSFI